MAEINLSQKNFTDYSAALYFKALGVEHLKMELKTVTIKDTGEVVPLIHISGKQMTTGVLVNMDIWPRFNATTEDLEKLPEKINEFYFRIGYATEYDLEKKTYVTYQSNPKWLVINPDSDNFKLSGEKRVNPSYE